LSRHQPAGTLAGGTNVDPGTGPTVVALLTSHERRDHTLAALEALHGQRLQGGRIRAVLVDAGSTDGTADSVQRRFPGTEVLRVGRDVFWNRGMSIGLQHARRTNPDYYLWLNDDTVLDDDALNVLVGTALRLRERRDAPPSIVVGTTRDPVTGEPTYGGVHRPDPLRPMRFALVRPGTSARRSETMHGNCVLLPREVVERVGNLEAGYTHAMGDFDYGLRAGAAGLEVWVAPGTVGACARNPIEARSTRAELRHLAGPKGLPPREWRLFTRRWAGPMWLLYFVSPYVRRLLGSGR
jgi:GT2 family glycosyltransferase